jgi:hypothetical protein
VIAAAWGNRTAHGQAVSLIAARDHLTILDEPASDPHIETMMLANGDC